jgi:hypothetical protein
VIAVNPNQTQLSLTKENNMSSISNSDVVSAVQTFVSTNNRPCPSHFLTEKFGDDVLDVIDELKASGVLLGLRGRNGGLATPDSEIVAKRSAKSKTVSTTNEPAQESPQTAASAV